MPSHTAVRLRPRERTTDHQPRRKSSLLGSTIVPAGFLGRYVVLGELGQEGLVAGVVGVDAASFLRPELGVGVCGEECVLGEVGPSRVVSRCQSPLRLALTAREGQKEEHLSATFMG